MNWKKTFAVVRREYVERVRTKAFWIATLLIPILFLGYVAIQVALSRKTGGERKLVVVDLTGKLYAPLVAELAATEAKQKKESSGAKGPHWSLVGAARDGRPRRHEGGRSARKSSTRRSAAT